MLLPRPIPTDCITRVDVYKRQGEGERAAAVKNSSAVAAVVVNNGNIVAGDSAGLTIFDGAAGAVGSISHTGVAGGVVGKGIGVHDDLAGVVESAAVAQGYGIARDRAVIHRQRVGFSVEYPRTARIHAFRVGGRAKRNGAAGDGGHARIIYATACLLYTSRCV